MTPLEFLESLSFFGDWCGLTYRLDFEQKRFYDKLRDRSVNEFEIVEECMDWIEYEFDVLCDDEDIAKWFDDLGGSDIMYEAVDSSIPVYDSEVFKWLAEDTNNQLYVDEATGEFGPQDTITRSIRLGMYMMTRDVYYSVIESIKEMFDEYYEPEEGDSDGLQD